MKINIGGTKGWKKVDPKIQEQWKILDLNKSADFIIDLNEHSVTFPFADNSVECYYASHIFEHIYSVQLRMVLSEIYRTLKPNGAIRIVVPNIRYGIFLYMNRPEDLKNKKYPFHFEGHGETHLGYLMDWWQSPDKSNSSGHHNAFDAATLHTLLDIAGLKRAKSLDFNQCSRVFDGLDFPRYKDWCLFIEATKIV